MTSTTFDGNLTRQTDTRVIGLVSAAHFVSHLYILVLPPLFLFVRADFNVSYTELGVAISVFSIISAVLQTPAGFLVDRMSARTVLIGGLALGGASLVAAAFVTSYYAFVLMFALLGIANTVYHPADYVLLSSRVSAPRMSHAYSIHTFAGFIGTAVAPASLLLLAQYFGWRGAFIGAGMLGFAVAAVIAMFGDTLGGRDPVHAKPKSADPAPQASDWRVLMSTPVLLNLMFFILISGGVSGIQSYGVVALGALWGSSLELATWALTAYLFMSALGVLIGGMFSARTDRHDLVAIVGQALTAAALLPIAFFDFGAVWLIGLMGISGFFGGLIHPSRDMIVRSVTPPGAFGKVFGFVTTGFLIGGAIVPPVFGYLMDHGSPRSIIVASAILALISIPIVMITVARGGAKEKQP